MGEPGALQHRLHAVVRLAADDQGRRRSARPQRAVREEQALQVLPAVQTAEGEHVARLQPVAREGRARLAGGDRPELRRGGQADRRHAAGVHAVAGHDVPPRVVRVGDDVPRAGERSRHQHPQGEALAQREGVGDVEVGEVVDGDHEGAPIAERRRVLDVERVDLVGARRRAEGAGQADPPPALPHGDHGHVSAGRQRAVERVRPVAREEDEVGVAGDRRQGRDEVARVGRVALAVPLRPVRVDPDAHGPPQGSACGTRQSPSSGRRGSASAVASSASPPSRRTDSGGCGRGPPRRPAT